MNDQGEPICTPKTASKATPKSISKSKTKSTPKLASKSTEKSIERSYDDPNKRHSERTRCKICSAKFETSLDLDSHLITEHQHEANGLVKNANQNSF